MKNHFESFLWLIDSSWNDSYIYILNTFAIGASFSAKFKLKYHHFLFNFYANKSSLLKVTKNTFLIFNLAMILTLTSRPMFLKFMKVVRGLHRVHEGLYRSSWRSSKVFMKIFKVFRGLNFCQRSIQSDRLSRFYNFVTRAPGSKIAILANSNELCKMVLKDSLESFL